MATPAGMHALRRRDVVHLADIKPRSNARVAWERVRHRQAHWVVECLAEMTGVFFYVYAGVGSTANFFFGNSESVVGLSSMFQIGVAYAMGIVFALVVCSATSGGHFNPAMTICFTVTGRFPARKALQYIAAQIFGAYIACLLIYVQWGDPIREATAALEKAGVLEAVMFTPNGPAGVFALYAPTGGNLGRIFLNEFVCDFAIGLVIFSCLDPTNFFVVPASAPWIIGLCYGMVVWGYATVGVATNAARDVGARLMALTIWGTAAGGGKYAAIAALTNIPATLLAMLFYEYVLTDSSRVVTPGHAAMLNGHIAHEEHSQGLVPETHHGSHGSSSLDEKAQDHHVENV